MNYTSFNTNEEFFVDMQRCIGCKACEMACAECETNGQDSMIHV
ncbi:MAG TPA: 4Fe-4S binding protein, partial [Flavobacterium sp.]|nr:4Fe-4S binding protein [Flavobacterium sp.]